jgi:hypothetical protein
LAQRLRQVFRIAVGRSRAKKLAVEQKQAPQGRAAERMRFVQNSLEHGSEVTRRRIDDLEDLRGRGPLFERLARLGDQPRVFHCDDRLRGEILQ